MRRPVENELSPKVRRGAPRTPLAFVFAAWNWKTASVSALLRAGLFFATNRRAGQATALRSALVEGVFAIFAAGLLGAATERLRAAERPVRTGLLVWLGLPTLAVAAQALVHHLAGTPHLRTGLVVSFAFASVASGCTWLLQRRGFLLTWRAASPQE